MLLRLTMRLTRDVRDGKQVYRHMILNVLAGNRDGHPKDRAFMMDASGAWHRTRALLASRIAQLEHVMNGRPVS